MKINNVTSTEGETAYISWLLAEFHEWIQDRLPAWNCSIERDNSIATDLIHELNKWVSLLYQQGVCEFSALKQNDARLLIQLLGFAVSSVERHTQSSGMQPGEGLAKLVYAEEIMGKLSRIAHHPPRDSHYTYWLWNSQKDPLTFTGNSQEVFFNRVVNQTEIFHSDSCNNLRQLCENKINVCSPTAIDAMIASEQNMLNLWREFRAFMDPTENLDRRNVEPLFFMTRMRTYLTAYPIQGEMWSGVNAANLASQMQIDYLIGTVSYKYRNVIKDRMRYLTVEDQNLLLSDTKLPSVADCLIKEIGLTPMRIQHWDEQSLVSHIGAQPSTTLTALNAYKRLVLAAAKLSAMHWALIQNYLVKPANELDQHKHRNLAVKPDAGTGGKTHKETKAIMEMRRRHPLIGKLINVIPVRPNDTTMLTRIFG